MGTRRGRTDHQLIADLLIREPVRDECRYLFLSRGQLIGTCVRWLTAVMWDERLRDKAPGCRGRFCIGQTRPELPAIRVRSTTELGLGHSQPTVQCRLLA